MKLLYTFNKGVCRGCGATLSLFHSALSVRSIYHGYVVNVGEWTMSFISILSAEFHKIKIVH